MSIDAKIGEVITEGNNLILKLKEREKGQLIGQPSLTIMGFTHKPIINQEVWGGSNSIIIEPHNEVKEQKNYKRIRYTKLEEDF